MILPIVKAPNSLLKEVCKPITDIDGDIISLANNMLETAKAAGGIGLAAPQVGHLVRMFVFNNKVAINPEIWEYDEANKIISTEGCLSIPGQTFNVIRYKDIKVKYDTICLLNDGPYYRLQHLEAIIFQHELDHLNGKLICDDPLNLIM